MQDDDPDATYQALLDAKADQVMVARGAREEREVAFLENLTTEIPTR